jgi:antirestriction protein ArdC
MAFKSKYRSQPTARTDVYQTITDQIVKLLETGVRPWSRSWGGSDITVRPLRVTGEPYRGINVLVLWMTAQANGYSSPTWMTFNQTKEFGANVRKGEKGTQVVLYKTQVVNAGTDDEKKFGVLRTFTVFNCDQIDNLPAKFLVKAEPVVAVAKNERIPHVDAFFDAIPVKLSHGGAKAFYVPSQDRVQLPNFEDFFTPEAYYCTKGHEYTHWTRHETRLDRSFEQKRWGDEGYAMEELVAELAAAYLAADLGLENQPREDHASYIAHWLKVLKNDSHAIFTAASYAEKAVKYLTDLTNPVTATVVAEDDVESEDGFIDEKLAA